MYWAHEHADVSGNELALFDSGRSLLARRWDFFTLAKLIFFFFITSRNAILACLCKMRWFSMSLEETGLYRSEPYEPSKLYGRNLFCLYTTG